MIKHIIFKVVGKCNLECPYCYYMTDLSSKWEKRFDPAGFKEMFSKLADYTDSIRVSWHGGEPLLAGTDFFETAIREAAHHGVNIRHSIQTNGLLVNDKWCSFFKEHDFNVGVSIDGPEKLHNRERPKKSSSGLSSYQGAKNAIDLLNQHGVRSGTLTVVHPNESGKEVFEHLLGLGVKSMDFLLPISSSRVDIKELEGCAKYLIEIFDRWVEIGDSSIKIRYFENIMKSVMGAPPKQCILTNKCNPYITIEPNGDIGVCENIRMVNSDLYETGLNIHQHEFNAIENELDKKLSNSGFNRLGSECIDCDFVNACRGGCPVARYDGLLGFNQPSHYCLLYKTIIFHVFKYVHSQLPSSGNSSLAIEVA